MSARSCVGLVLGGAALVWYGPDVEQIAVGARAPDYRVMDLATGDSVSPSRTLQGARYPGEHLGDLVRPLPGRDAGDAAAIRFALAPRGFRIAAVSIDQEGPEVVRDFAASLKLTFDILQDRSGNIQQAYQTTGVPESFLLDTNGIIMKRVIGAHDWTAPVNTALIHRLLGDPVARLGPDWNWNRVSFTSLASSHSPQ